MEKITEKESLYDSLETMSTTEILTDINREDHRIADAVQKVLPQIGRLVDAIVERMKQGGRVFYIGAGTSGRLGIVDASELPPTFGVDEGKFIGIIAGGEGAIRHAVEKAEDDEEKGWHDIMPFHPTPLDTVVGIAASGTTPYVIGAIKKANQNGLLTGGITSNPGAPLAENAQHLIEVVLGPEFVTGSSRMKSGTAQKMILNMISTATMIKMGRVMGNRMVDMQLTNKKLIERGSRMIMDALGVDYEEAERRLLKEGSVRGVIEN